MVLAIGPQFIRRSGFGNWMGAVILLAGCYGTAGENLPQAFVERGASVVIGWNGLVSADQADAASLTLVRLLFEEKMTVGAAFEQTMLQVGEDPSFHSLLTFYPVDPFPDQHLWIAIDPILREEYQTVLMMCEGAFTHPQPVSAYARQDIHAIFE